jgi:hypothetical protein
MKRICIQTFCIALSGALACTLALAAEPPDPEAYRIERCQQPLTFHLRRLPSEKVEGSYTEWGGCAGATTALMDLNKLDDEDDPSHSDLLEFVAQAKGQTVTMTLSQPGAKPSVQKLTINGRETSLAWKAAGPLRIRVSATNEPNDLLVLIAKDAPVKQIAEDVAKAMGYELSGLKLFENKRTTFVFSQIPATNALALLADVSCDDVSCNRVFMPTGTRSFRLETKKKEIIEIEKLRDASAAETDTEEVARLKRTIELAKPFNSEGFQAISVSEELELLAKLAVRQGSYPQARAYYHQVLVEQAIDQGKPASSVSDDPAKGQLLGQAELELTAGNIAAARAILQSITTKLVAQGGLYHKDLPPVLRLQAQLPDIAGEATAATALLQRALLIVEENGGGTQLVPMLDALASLQERQGSWAAAEAQRRRAIAELEKGLRSDTPVLEQWLQLAKNLDAQGKNQEALESWRELALRLADVKPSVPYLGLMALREWAAHRLMAIVEGALTVAALEQRDPIDPALLRSVAFGQLIGDEQHPRVVAAIREFTLFYTMKRLGSAGQPFWLLPHKQGLLQLTAPENDKALAKLSPQVRAEVQRNVLDGPLQQLNEALRTRFTAANLDRANRLQWRAEIQLICGGQSAVTAVLADYAELLAIRRKLEPTSKATHELERHAEALQAWAKK